MQILTHHFESTNPLHISRVKIIAFELKPGQKESEYIQAFHSQIIDANLHVAPQKKKFLPRYICIPRFHSTYVRRELISRRQTTHFKPILEYALNQEAATQPFIQPTGKAIITLFQYSVHSNSSRKWTWPW